MPAIVHPARAEEFEWPALVDVMICDPPYRPHVHAAIRSCAAQVEPTATDGRRNKAYRPGTRQNDLGFSAITDELRAWLCRFACERVRRWSVIFTDIESVGAWAAGLGAHYIRAIPWIRWSMPQLSGDRPCQGSEMVVVAWGMQRGKKSWNGPGNLTHLAHKCLRGEGKHRTEKPLDQGLDLVAWFSNPGELVVDPVAGSGTFLKAALMLNRRALGTELDPAWAAKAEMRCLAPVLSPRDAARHNIWQVYREAYAKDLARMRAHTASVRSKSEERRAMAMVDDYLCELSTLTHLSPAEWKDLLALPAPVVEETIAGYRAMTWATDPSVLARILSVLESIVGVAGAVSGVAGAAAAIKGLAG